MPGRLITETGALAQFCQQMREGSFVTVDTEFMRERTYWPKLCLVQIAGAEEARAIDALADGLDLSPLFELLDDPRVLKVFHAAHQDLEIFHYLTGRLPTPLFDTQIAAMVCGFGDSVGYETLVARLAKARIDKSSRFTDWSLRPLSPRQVDYALADVTHLRIAYERLARRLARTKRADWVAEEMAALSDPRRYAVAPEEAFRRIRLRRPTARALAVLRELAAWREREARRLDVPRNRVVRDEALVELAEHAPTTIEDIKRTRALPTRLAEGAVGAALLDAIRRARALPEALCPSPQIRPAPPRGLGPLIELLKVLLKHKCEESEVAQRLVASVEDIERLATDGEAAEVPALHGWRRAVFGDDALKVRAGALALAAHDGRLRLLPLERT